MKHTMAVIEYSLDLDTCDEYMEFCKENSLDPDNYPNGHVYGHAVLAHRNERALIAAAPEMLEALELAAQYFKTYIKTDKELKVVETILKGTISKAKGES